jgi:hypothetical protein
LVAIVALSTSAFAEDNYSKDHSKFDAYKQRLAERRANALDLRRQYNLAKGPHVYRTSTVYPGPRLGDGFVVQPPIPVRPIISLPYPAVHYSHNYVPHVRSYRTPLVNALVAK